MKRTPAAILALLSWLSAALADPAALFQEAENLNRQNLKPEAMERIEKAATELDRAFAGGEKIDRRGMDALRLGAKLAREDFLDFEKSLSFCDQLERLADSEYWKTPAHLERALTYRAMGEFDQANAEYDAIVAFGERYAPSALLPRAEMVIRDLRDEARGGELLQTALMNEAVNVQERTNALFRHAAEHMERGDREGALQWYALAETLPVAKPEDRERALSRAWFEMGQIEESRGKAASAKTLYRKAIALENGDKRQRVRARDALEAIEYFE